MRTWDYEINGNVRSGVDDHAIRRLLGNGTLDWRSRIREVGSATWITIERSEFGPMLRVSQASSSDFLPAIDSSTSGRSVFLWIAFGLLVVIGFVLDLFAPRATSLGDVMVRNTSVLQDIDILLVCAVVAIFISAQLLAKRVHNLTAIVRTAELVKAHELMEIRRLLSER